MRGIRLALLATAALCPGTAQGQAGLTTLASVGSQGQQGELDSRFPDVSANGRVVGFCGESASLVPGDTNGLDDVFVHDRISGLTERISVSTAGVQANARCRYPTLASNGRWVAFVSLADTLTPGVPAFGTVNVYLRDRLAGVTTLLSANAAGQSGNYFSTYPSISADGGAVTFISRAENLVAGDTDELIDIYVRDVGAGTLAVVSVSSSGQLADGDCSFPDISGDGDWVAFASLAANLVPGDTNGKQDIFVHDRQGGTTARVSVASDGSQANGASFRPTISADGRLVAFTSRADNLVSGDTNGASDVFVHDRATGLTVRASVATSGVQGDASCGNAEISENGRFVVFSSEATQLVTGDVNALADIFRHDLQSGETILLSQGSLGQAADGRSVAPRTSGDGSVSVFESHAESLVPGDVNLVADAFVRDLSPCPMTGRYCQPKTNSLGCVPWLDWSGVATLTGPDDFHLTASDVLNQHLGILIWGRDADPHPFQGGMLCVTAPQRTPTQSSGGNPPTTTDCSGSYDFFFSQAFLAAAGLAAGDVVYAQYWSRDTGLPPPDGVGLTGAAHFLVCP